MSWVREPNAEPIPGYRLIQPLGSGGFGEVWKCEAPGGLFKAIKFVYGNLNSLDVDGVRAEQELKALQRIKEVRHPFVCSLDRIEVVEGELVIVMELADKSLYDLFVECQAAGLIGIPRNDLLRYLRDAAEALDHMNDKHGLQHLDVKPRNLFLISDRVKVADFGLVKHLERHSASGILGAVTPLYAPPETFNGKISERSDQYSLAIVYQELLTGHRPFSGKNVRQLAQQHLQEEPDLRALPEAERPVLARALAKDPAKRFPTCMGLIRALFNARQQSPLDSAAAAASAGGGNGHPKTLVETLEDFQLEQLAEESGEPAAAKAPPKPGAARATAPRGTDSDPALEVSSLGITVAQPQTGALRPTLVIGLGSFGRKALLELRCRFLDRFGDLARVPLLRFLFVDTDPETVRLAGQGAPEVAFAPREVHHLPLQPVGQYRRRNLEQLSEWLPREKLYAMPRSLQTNGSRALGRLAFADNHQRLLARVRKDVQEITHPDALYQSVTQTGLALRDSTPRLFVIAAAGGGCSGLMTDLGFALRRLLGSMRHPDAPVVSLLLCGAPADPATPKAEQANVYATLTELNHFSDPAIPFSAQYSADGQRILDAGAPFQSVYLLQLAHRSPESLNHAVAHLGSYLFHELTTPLGLRLDQLRQEEAGADRPDGIPTPFRSFGTYAVWFPRGLLLRLAARHACQRFLEDWLQGSDPNMVTTPAEVAEVLNTVQAGPGLKAETLAARIDEAATAAWNGERGSLASAALPVPLAPHHADGSSPGEHLTGLLAGLAEQSQQAVAQEDPANWARSALNRVREWVGVGGDNAQDVGDWRKNRLHRIMTAAAQKVAEQWDQENAPTVFAVMDRPGGRVAVAEAVLVRLQQWCMEAADGLAPRSEQQAARTQQVWRELDGSLADCVVGGGGFRLFGGRSVRKQLGAFMEQLAAFARQRLAEERAAAVQHFYVALRGRFADRLRDLGFCRLRLRALQENLDLPVDEAAEDTPRGVGDATLARSPLPSAESFWEAVRRSETARVVLPDGEEDLERAAVRFLRQLTPDQWGQLDQTLYEHVLTPLGGLHAACVQSGDLARTLSRPLLAEASRLLGEHLQIMDVAQVLCAEVEGELSAGDLGAEVKASMERAAPLVARADKAAQQAFLLVPASDAGKALSHAARKPLPDVKTVTVPGQSDLMFCREQGYLTLEELQRVLRNCRAAYEATATAPSTSPHARFDVMDWVPLDP
jgi:hypothetical protein